MSWVQTAERKCAGFLFKGDSECHQSWVCKQIWSWSLNCDSYVQKTWFEWICQAKNVTDPATCPDLSRFPYPPTGYEKLLWFSKLMKRTSLHAPSTLPLHRHCSECLTLCSRNPPNIQIIQFPLDNHDISRWNPPKSESSTNGLFFCQAISGWNHQQQRSMIGTYPHD